MSTHHETSFPRFPRLPVEIREMIWKASIIGRQIPLTIQQHARLVWRFRQHLFSPHPSLGNPPAMDSCCEARYYISKEYKVLEFQIVGPCETDHSNTTGFMTEKIRFLFNPRVDVITRHPVVDRSERKARRIADYQILTSPTEGLKHIDLIQDVGPVPWAIPPLTLARFFCSFFSEPFPTAFWNWTSATIHLVDEFSTVENGVLRRHALIYTFRLLNPRSPGRIQPPASPDSLAGRTVDECMDILQEAGAVLVPPNHWVPLSHDDGLDPNSDYDLPVGAVPALGKIDVFWVAKELRSLEPDSGQRRMIQALKFYFEDLVGPEVENASPSELPLQIRGMCTPEYGLG
ncbi:hypothetical protein QBC43DRAFT_334250 [Cladorrhinum sp. PSN259]|nr:hypothetical protein QBC43DRAFT_334250 [Cladorrhinum sp. PSN259]